jgi:hypothetical protein
MSGCLLHLLLIWATLALEKKTEAPLLGLDENHVLQKVTVQYSYCIRSIKNNSINNLIILKKKKKGGWNGTGFNV